MGDIKCVWEEGEERRGKRGGVHLPMTGRFFMYTSSALQNKSTFTI